MKQVSLNKAFTLVEILLVVVIIGALSAMIIPRLSGRSEQAKVQVARADIDAQISTALKLYELDNGTFPSTSQGLMALRKKPTNPPMAKNWRGPYIEKDPVDPWGNMYQYASPGKNRSDYDLWSEGVDPASSSDNITNWQ